MESLILFEFLSFSSKKSKEVNKAFYKVCNSFKEKNSWIRKKGKFSHRNQPSLTTSCICILWYSTYTAPISQSTASRHEFHSSQFAQYSLVPCMLSYVLYIIIYWYLIQIIINPLYFIYSLLPQLLTAPVNKCFTRTYVKKIISRTYAEMCLPNKGMKLSRRKNLPLVESNIV